MRSDRKPSRPVGRPALRATLLRSLRSNVVATALALWAIGVAGIGITVLIQNTGTDRPFHSGSTSAPELGATLAQWWVLSIVGGMCVLAPVLAVHACAATGERGRLESWRSTLVGPSRVVGGLWQAQLAVLLLALTMSFPVAGTALALGGTSIAQLGVGLAAAFLCGATWSALAIAVSCRSTSVVRPLILCTLLVALVLGGPVAVHGFRATSRHAADATLLANPLVGAADAAAPRVHRAPNTRSAASAPLDHLMDMVEPQTGRFPPWGWTAIGATVILAMSLTTSRLRIARPESGRRSADQDRPV